MGLSLRSIGKRIGDIAGGVERQINPLDAGLSYKTKVATPQNAQQGVAQQAFNFVKPVVQLPVQFSENYANTFANIGNKLGGGQNQTIQQNMGADALNKKILEFSGATGKNVQLAGDAAQIALAAAAPGASKIIEGGIARALPGVAKTVLPRVVSNAAIGGGFNASAAAGNGAKPGEVAKAFGQGAALGGAFPVAGAALKPVVRLVRGTEITKQSPASFTSNEYDQLNKLNKVATKRILTTQEKSTRASLAAKKNAVTIQNEPFNADEYVNQQVKAQEDAAKGNVPGRGVAFKNKFRQKFVDSLAPIEDPIIAAKGREGALPLRNQLDRALRTDLIADSEDNGLHQVIQNVPDTKAFDQYLIAKHAQDLEANGIKTGRDLGKDQQLIDSLGSEYEQHAQALQRYNHGLLDKATDYGLISKETADHLKQKYPNYVPFDRIFTDAEQQLQKGSGKGIASVATNTLEKKLRGSDRVIQSPLESILNKTKEVIDQGERNLAARQLIETGQSLEGNPFGIKNLRNAEDVGLRYENYKKLQESRPIRDALAREVKRTVKQVRGMSSRNKELSPQILEKIQKSGDQVRNNAIKMANGIDKLSGRGKKLVKLPGEADIQEAFQQYLDGNPKLVRQMYEFIGNKKEIERTQNTLDGLKAQFDAVKAERKAQFNEARLHADASARGKATISTFKNGIKEIYEVNPEIAAAAKSLNKEQLGFLAQVFAVPTRILRLGATSLNPAFALANVAKDTVSAFINSEHSLRASPANPKVFLAALKASAHHGSAEYQELVSQGAGGTSFDIARNAAPMTVKRIRAGKNLGTKGIYTVTHPGELIRAVENTIGRSEEFNRAIQYFGNKEAALAKGADEGGARAYAADAARNNTVNFARAGDYGRVLNTVLPYLNAGFQGSRTLLRNLKERPAQTGAKLAIAGFMPVAATTAWNLSDPNRKKAYDSISDYEKQNNIIIIGPNVKQDSQGRWSGIIKIPTSQEIANLNNVVRNGVEDMHKDKSFNFAGALGDLIGTGTSLNAQNPRQAVGQITPQAVKPFAETALNQNLFTGQQIVPDAQKNLNPQDQFNKGTSGTARVIGKLTGTSPLQIDNAIRTTTGGLGQNIIHETDTALNKVGVIPKDQVKGQSLFDSIANRFNSAQGQTPGSQYFTTLQKTAHDQHLAGSDYDQLNSITSKSLTTDGTPKPLNDQDALEKNRILASSPNIAKVIADTAVALAKKQGKDVDPLYSLTAAQQRAYYQIQATPYKSDDYNKLVSNARGWLPTLQDARSVYYQKNPIPVGGTPSDKVKYPSFSSNVSSLLDQAGQLDGAERAQFIQTHPDLQKAYDQISQYTNDKRIAQGYDPFKAYPTATPDVQKAIDTYNGLAKGDGTRSTWIKSHPDTYAQMQSYYAQSAAWELANNAGSGKYAGSTIDQKTLKAAYSLGKYDIVKNPDGTYALGSSYSSGGSGGSGGSGSKYTSRTAAELQNPVYNAIDIGAGGKPNIGKASKPKTSKVTKFSPKKAGFQPKVAAKPKVTLKKNVT